MIIVVNGREWECHQDQVGYQYLIGLANGLETDEITYTCIYPSGQEERGRILPGNPFSLLPRCEIAFKVTRGV